MAQGFVFAIEEINRSTHLLPNLTLGFSIRNSGDSVHGALHETMAFLTGQEDPVPNYACQLGPPQAALVGDTRSALSVAMARLLRLYKFPQVSPPQPCAFTTSEDGSRAEGMVTLSCSAVGRALLSHSTHDSALPHRTLLWENLI